MSSVLFDEPGPRGRMRHRLYGVMFGVVAGAALIWVVLKLDDSGQFESQIFDRLSQSNVWSALADGVIATLEAAALGIAGALTLGLGLAVARLSDHAWLRVPARTVIEFFRAVPLLLLIIFVFALASEVSELKARALLALFVGLTLYNGAVLAEVFRAGVHAVPRGQSEAAYAIGLRKAAVLRHVLLPQAVRFMLPAIVSQCVVALKDTALGFVIVYPETLRTAREIAQYANNNLWPYLLAAAIFIAINSVLSAVAVWLERRLSQRGRGAVQQIKAAEGALPPA